MTTALEVIAWLDKYALHYDLLRETHTRNNRSIPAAVATIQVETVSHLADELRRMVAETQPLEAKT